MVRNFFVLALIAIGLGILAFFFSSNTEAPANAEELRELLERVGPIEAQEIMLHSGLPFTGQTHLLIHVVGDYIYDQYGLEGLPYCRDYFLSACYHGFIINTLADHGLLGVSEAMERCKSAAPGVSAQCAHAAGHGFVAWHDYDLLKALKMCDELGEKTANFGYFNCYDGVFMENLWGVHDGKPSEKRWLKEGDLHYPCNDPRIPEKYLRGCWANQATLIYQHYKGDLKKTAEECEAVLNEEHRDACYDNWARQIHPLTEGKKEKVFSLCAATANPERREECILTNMSASWAVGDRVMPFDLCASLAGEVRETCFERLISVINFHYASESEKRDSYCDKIRSKEHQDACKK